MHATPIALLMETRADMRADLTAVLQQRFQVLAASNPIEAVTHLWTRHPDLVLWSSSAEDATTSGNLHNVHLLHTALAMASRCGSRFIIFGESGELPECPEWVERVTDVADLFS